MSPFYSAGLIVLLKTKLCAGSCLFSESHGLVLIGNKRFKVTAALKRLRSHTFLSAFLSSVAQ